MSDPEILLLDDDRVINLVHKKVIKKIFPSIKIKTYTSPLECLAVFEESTAVKRLLFLDIHMPQVSGWQFLERLGKGGLDEHLVVYIVSSSVDYRDVERVQKYVKVVDYLEKPLSTDRLLQIKREFCF
ncbi:response regulator [Echinicola strongylocentroti]|uniref:Response regulator n=1 Tax=Echinicola strongylocentroti TaxID=1795355 RepID=A0A2Z4IFE5_9BACT|nr:response regulator [Echinicola strongylocentroti]AWW29499.1 response regulator [Echinicola strongylocentroti]